MAEAPKDEEPARDREQRDIDSKWEDPSKPNRGYRLTFWFMNRLHAWRPRSPLFPMLGAAIALLGALAALAALAAAAAELVSRILK
jgi:hypothetical protein